LPSSDTLDEFTASGIAELAEDPDTGSDAAERTTVGLGATETSMEVLTEV
jgi:hypothetical protein